MNKTSEGMIQMQKQCSCKNGMEICTDCFMDHHWECHPVSKPSEEKEYKCINCGKPVGNTVFTKCDDCFLKKEKIYEKKKI